MANPTIEAKYTETYSENTTNITTGADLILRYDTAQTLAEVKADVVTWCRSHQRDFDGRQLSTVSISQEEGSLGDVWQVHCEWSTRPKNEQQQNNQYPQQPGVYPQESFSSIGGTAHVSQAYDEVGICVDGVTPAPPMFGGIGWNGDRFEGIDIVSPTFEFNLAYKYPYDSITTAVRNNWLLLTGCVNSDSFAGFSPGEVLYCGFSGGSSTEYDGELINIDGTVYQKAKNYYNITHQFKCSPNVSNMSIAGVQINKLGWEYVWPLKRKYDDPDTGMTIEEPVAVYRDQVYRYASFQGAF